MKIKRLLSAAISFVIGIAAFAQGTDYSSLLAKAKEYESKNKYVYAAATYFDAMVQNPTAEALEAYTAFNEIINLFKSGKPGKGEFDDFTKAAGWVEVAKEAEEYFTLNAPFDVQIYYAKGELNTTNRTCTYYFAPHIQYSEKAKLIIDAIKSGIDKCEGSPLRSSWPRFSAYNSSAKTGKAAVTGVTVPASPKALVGYCTIDGPYLSDKYPAGKTYYSPAWAINYFQYSANTYPNVRCSFYNLAIDIVDENGKVIATLPSKRMNYVDPAGNYRDEVSLSLVFFQNLFEDTALSKVTVDADGYKAINEGKYSFRVNSVVLANTDLSANVVSVTKEIFGKKSTSNVALFSETQKNAINVNKDNIRFCKPHNCNPKEMYWLDEYCSHKIDIIWLMKSETERIAREKKDINKLRNLSFGVMVNGEDIILRAKESLEFSGRGKNYKYYIMNRASVEEGLEPVYSLNGETDTDKWDLSDSDNDEIKIVSNPNANGYRTEENGDSYYSSLKFFRVPSGAEKEKYVSEYMAEKNAERAALAKEDVKNLRDAEYLLAVNEEKAFMYSDKYISFKLNKENYKYYILNCASVEEGLEPVYSLNGESDPSKWALSFSGDYKGKVELNPTANGYKIIGEEERSVFRDLQVYRHNDFCKGLPKAEAEKHIAECRAAKDAEREALRKSNVDALLTLDFKVFIDQEKAFMYSTKTTTFPKTENYVYYILNCASVEEGLEPVYSLNGESDPSKWVPSFSGDFSGKIEQNPKANGYRKIQSADAHVLDSLKIYNYKDFCRLLSPEEKEEAEREIQEAELARQKRIDDAVAEVLSPFKEQFLKDPKEYKSLFKNVKGSFTVNIPLVGETNVRLDFYVSQVEVTQGLYEKIMGTNPSQGVKNELYPVNNVSVYEAMVFCNKLSIAAGLTPAYTFNKTTDPDKWGEIPTAKDAKWDKITVSKKADGFRLPTSEEFNAYSNNTSIRYDKVYYVALAESASSITVEKVRIYKPVQIPPNKFGLYNTDTNILEMFRDPKVCGAKVGREAGSINPSAKDPRIGFRVVSGKN
ncbi:MAG: SUMF1/EgtB/PvdO family nonheme iron enzyme [Treponema sp.]